MMRLVICLLLFTIIQQGITLDQEEFHGGTLLQVNPKSNNQFEKLQTFIHQHIGTLDIWKEPQYAGDSAAILVPHSVKHDIISRLQSSGLNYNTLHDDIQDAVNTHLAENMAQRYDTQSNYSRYIPHEEILQWVDRMIAKCKDLTCSKSSIGKTYEQKEMYVLKISSGPGRIGFWMDGGIHAREWISPATVMYITEQLITLRDSDDKVKNLTDVYDWYILPVMNVDGYIYSWKDNTTRLWRKSRKPVNATCTGTDINRNFDFHWDTVGTSNNACSNIYPGPKAFSESEAKNVADFIRSKPKGSFHAFITVHSYSQLFMPPYGYTTDPPPNYSELLRAGRVFADALRAVHGTVYRVDSPSKILYPNSGTSRDWAMGVGQIQYVYTIELRDNGTYGFLLPPEQIRPTGEETWAGIKAFALDIAGKIPVSPAANIKPQASLLMLALGLFLLSFHRKF